MKFWLAFTIWPLKSDLWGMIGVWTIACSNKRSCARGAVALACVARKTRRRACKVCSRNARAAASTDAATTESWYSATRSTCSMLSLSCVLIALRALKYVGIWSHSRPSSFRAMSTRGRPETNREAIEAMISVSRWRIREFAVWAFVATSEARWRA